MKRISLIILSFVILAAMISAGCLYALRQSSFYKPSYLVNEVVADDFDYIIIGASTGLTTLNTKVIDSVLGVNGVNLSIDDTAIASQYLMLQHFLAEGKTTKYCVLAPNPMGYDIAKDDLSDNDYRFMPYVNRDYVSRYYQSFSGMEANLSYTSKWLPMLGVGYYNAELFYPSIVSLISPEKHNRFDTQGNYTYPKVQRQDQKVEKRTDTHLKFKNNYLEKIQELCRKNNIELICYVSPMLHRNILVDNPDYKVINHSHLIQTNALFYDELHVNSEGRETTSKQFAQDLIQLASNSQ
ncbi:hypothetical protein ACU8DI_09750 [Psychroserpens sp. BH13MA-6]